MINRIISNIFSLIITSLKYLFLMNRVNIGKNISTGKRVINTQCNWQWKQIFSNGNMRYRSCWCQNWIYRNYHIVIPGLLSTYFLYLIWSLYFQEDVTTEMREYDELIEPGKSMHKLAHFITHTVLLIKYCHIFKGKHHRF